MTDYQPVDARAALGQLKEALRWISNKENVSPTDTAKMTYAEQTALWNGVEEAKNAIEANDFDKAWRTLRNTYPHAARFKQGHPLKVLLLAAQNNLGRR